MIHTLNEIIYKWFDMKLKTYDKLEHDNSIYLYYEGLKLADFRIMDNIVYYNNEVWDEYKITFDNYDSSIFEDVMGEFFSDYFKIKVVKTKMSYLTQKGHLEIPDKNL